MVEEIWPAKIPGQREISYIRDYSQGRLLSIIGAECYMSDLGGAVYLVDDPEVIIAINHGMSVEEAFTDETMRLELPPETHPPFELSFTTRKNYVAAAAYGHVLPPGEDRSIYMARFFSN